ncbi:MAG: NUDIX hydrolase [Wenzhouxiangellaceae bacterium]
MNEQMTILGSGDYLKLVRRKGWEFATRHNPLVVVIIAWTDDDELVLVEQYREPIRRRTIELPAGLVGDLEGQAGETLIEAAARELYEETGYRAEGFREIMRCPTSAGLTDEIAVFLRAGSPSQVGPGGGDASEDITVHRIAANRLAGWLQTANASGLAVDPKIYAAMVWREHECDQASPD